MEEKLEDILNNVDKLIVNWYKNCLQMVLYALEIVSYPYYLDHAWHHTLFLLLNPLLTQSYSKAGFLL